MQPPRPVVAVLRAPVREGLRVWHCMASRLRERRWQAVPLTAVTAAVVVAVGALYSTGPVRALADVCCSPRAGEPLLRWLVQVPGALPVPTPPLPVWAAAVMVLAAFGTAECVVGTATALAVGMAAHVVASAAGRMLVAMGPHTPLGLPAAAARIIDSGPSAATYGLAFCVAVLLRLPIAGGLLLLTLLLGLLGDPGLAAAEHVPAALVGVVAALWLRRQRPFPTQSGGGAES